MYVNQCAFNCLNCSDTPWMPSLNRSQLIDYCLLTISSMTFGVFVTKRISQFVMRESNGKKSNPDHWIARCSSQALEHPLLTMHSQSCTASGIKHYNISCTHFSADVQSNRKVCCKMDQMSCRYLI